MQTTQTAPQDKDTASQGELFASFELADKKWKLSLSDGRRGPSRYTVDAGDTDVVLECLTKARTRCGLSAQCKVRPCYEAGRDGWWLHRWLVVLGVDNIVVDAASIEVNRRARRAKTDRLDGDKLLAMLLRQHAGERVWSVLREPSAEAEDARRTHRELARLMHERTAHTNRIGSLLLLHNLRAHTVIGGRDWAACWDRHRTQVPPLLRAEIERESAWLKLVKDQIRALEVARRQEIEDGKQPLVAQLVRLRAIGPNFKSSCVTGALLEDAVRLSPAPAVTLQRPESHMPRGRRWISWPDRFDAWSGCRGEPDCAQSNRRAGRLRRHCPACDRSRRVPSQ